MNAVVLADWAATIDRGPRLDDATSGVEQFGALGLSIFAAFYGLRFLRRLLGA